MDIEREQEDHIEAPATSHGAPPPAGKSRPGAFWRIAKMAIVGAVGMIVLYFAGFTVFASHVAALKTPPNPPEADAIIVLTGGQFRLTAAVDLLKTGKGKRLLISGVNPQAGDAALRQATGANEALFSCCIDIDNVAVDTIGNADESAKWMDTNNYSSAIVVTNNYHMPRSLLELRKRAGVIELTPYPVVNSELDHGSWLVEPDALRVLFTEYAKLVAAIARNLVSTPRDGGSMLADS